MNSNKCNLEQETGISFHFIASQLSIKENESGKVIIHFGSNYFPSKKNLHIIFFVGYVLLGHFYRGRVEAA